MALTEQLEREPGQLIPEEYRGKVASNVVKVDLDRPMKEILAQLTKYPVTTQLSLNGTMIVARDIAHAKLKERFGQRRGIATVFKGSSGLLCRACQDADGHALRFFRSDDCRAHGFLCRPVSIARRFDDHPGEGQSRPRK